MKKILTILAVLAVSASFATAAEGDKKEGKKRDPEAMFKRIDADSDGKVTAEELKNSPMGKRNPDRVDEMFKKGDKNSDGSMDLEEFKASRQGGKKKGDT